MINHLRSKLTNHKYKMEIDPINTIRHGIMIPLTIENINHEENKYQYLKNLYNNKCEYKIYTQ